MRTVFADTSFCWSLTDCISFVIMEQLHIREAAAMDHHFVQAGFVALIE